MNLTLLAHGSPDPRHARSVAGLAARLRMTGISAQAAYLDHHEPRPAQSARALARSGAVETTVVPLLVGPAHHARVDVPRSTAAMRTAAPQLAVSVADPVGLHPLLLTAAAELLACCELPLDARTGVVLAAAGSRDIRVVNAMESFFRTHGARTAEDTGVRAVRAAYLDGGRPLGRIRTLMRSVDACSSFVVVPMVIADGIIRDRIVSAANRYDTPVTPGCLADTNALADLVAVRARAAAAPTRGQEPAARR